MCASGTLARPSILETHVAGGDSLVNIACKFCVVSYRVVASVEAGIGSIAYGQLLFSPLVEACLRALLQGGPPAGRFIEVLGRFIEVLVVWRDATGEGVTGHG